MDLTRLVSRIGRGPATGIDRVELAYLDRLLEMPVPCSGLVRTSLGFLLLNRDGMATLRGWLGGSGPDPVRDPLRLLRWRRSAAGRRAEAALAALAVARSHRLGLARMVVRLLPPGTAYLNVGHSNLTGRVLAALAAVPGSRVTVMLHDTIPLDLPRMQPPASVARFARKLRAVSRGADLVLHVSAAARLASERHLARAGRLPPGLVALNGIAPARPDAAAVPDGIRPETPYFVTLGTIEPRKNHTLLLDIWDQFAAERRASPHLLILGARGWANAEVFARLDRARTDNGLVREVAGLGDPAVASLLQGAAGLLMPSFAEGFGLPVAEAAALGVPVIANDLPVYREVAGEFPVYLRADHLYSWISTITTMSRAAAGAGAQDRRPVAVPTWEDHFKLVLSMT